MTAETKESGKWKKEWQAFFFAVVQSLSHVRLCDSMDSSGPGFPSFTVSQSLLKPMSIELGTPSNHSSSVILFSSCLQSFPASGSFLISLLFASGGQSIAASALASVLPVNIQGWFPLVLTSLILLAVQGTLKSLLQHHSLKPSILGCSAFFTVQPSHSYIRKNQSFD